MDSQPIATVELPGTPAEAVRTDVANLLRDTSMRVLEAVLAIGALATALLLSIGR